MGLFNKESSIKTKIISAAAIFILFAVVFILFQKDITAAVSGDKLNTWQKRKVEANLSAIVNTKDMKIAVSSNPYDYIKERQKEYDKITAMGKGALNYFLESFEKENETENGLRQWIMASACCDILGDSNPVKSWSSGREWYNKYTRVIDLREKYALASASEKISIEAQLEYIKTGPDTASAATSAALAAVSMVEQVNEGGLYTAKPVGVKKEDWLSNFAGGEKKTIKVRIGKLIRIDEADNIDQFIELEGNGGKLTLAANGLKNEFDEKTHSIKRRTVSFLTGKKIEGKQVVKDYSKDKQEFVLIIDYDDKGLGTPIAMFSVQNEDTGYPKDNYYQLEPLK